MTMHSYLRIDGAPGSCAESGYEHWIDCDSVSWSLRGPSVPGGVSEIRFVKSRDAASTALARLCIGASRLAGARFDFVRTGARGERTRCYEIVLEDVLVAHVATGPRRGTEMMETVVLTFAHARLTQLTDMGEPDETFAWQGGMRADGPAQGASR
ncbi:type VI secretion system tube protein Hcp [Massilia sp. METH4]|uniref:type VI secretion system tube protein Hcp n=1 Tax=Massilia sp. METH4 TaxID=3123041 RepID=UPI0030D17E06